MEIFASQLVNGLSLASIFLLVALGLNITFGMMGITNFAHGEFLMLGAYTSNILQVLVPDHSDIAYFVSIPAAFATAGLAGWISEKLLIRQLYGNPYGSILAPGDSASFCNSSRAIFWCKQRRCLYPSTTQRGISHRLPSIPYARLFIFMVALAALGGMAFLIYKTRLGRQMQAVMQLRPMASCMGINTRRIDTLTFVLGSGLAGIAGSMVALLGSIGPSTGQNYIIDSFLVVVLGGVGSLSGTLVGALMMGFASPFLEYFTNASMGKVILFALSFSSSIVAPKAWSCVVPATSINF
jgi:urea transport system permease protein